MRFPAQPGFWLRNWSLIHVLSLDIVAGAAASGALASAALDVQMRWGWWAILPLSVWVVYTADHLADGWKTGGNSVNPRHRFHYDHARILVVCLTAAAVVCAALALFAIREVVLFGGIILSLVAVLHLALARFSRFRAGKEVSVAFIYTAGIWFGPFLAADSVSVYAWILLILFLAATILNLIMNSIMESEMDAAEEMVYLLHFVPQERAERFVQIGSAACAFGGLLLAFSISRSGERIELLAAALVISCLGALPGLIVRIASRTSQLYRLAGEGVYLLGFLPWLLQML